MKRIKTFKSVLWKAIRNHCISCSGSYQEVQLCTCPDCYLYKFRFGRSLKDGDTEYIVGSVNKYKVSGKIIVGGGLKFPRLRRFKIPQLSI